MNILDEQQAAALFPGGGVTGELIRSIDWSRTQLGPVHRWPRALVAMVRMILASPQPMDIYWGNWSLHLYNDAMLPLVGENHPRAMGEPAEECWPAEWPAMGPRIAQVKQTGEPLVFTDTLFTIQREGRGEEAWFSGSYSPIYDDIGKVGGTIMVAADTTANVLARRTLEQGAKELAEAQLGIQSVIMQAPIAICMLRGPEHRFELANPMYLRLVGQRELTGKTIRESVPEVEGQGFFEPLDRVYKTGERHVGHEVPLRTARLGRKELEEAIINFVYEPFRNPNGSIAGILVVAADVTETVRARHAIEKALAESARLNKELAEADQALRSLVNNLPELAWSARPDGVIDFFNQRWFEYTGTSELEMQRSGWDKVQDPELLPKVNERWRQSVETGEPFEMEFPIRGADGLFRWFLTRVRPLRDSAEKLVRWFGTSTNIHAQREANLKAEEANTAKDEFLAAASHELRTPLTAILGWARLLRSGQLDPSGYARGVEVIERNAKAQVHLIEDILDGSQVLHGKLRLLIRPLDLTALVQGVFDSVRAAADAKEIELILTLDPDAAPITGDFERLQQVVWNLANNAVKFTPNGGAVAVRLRRAGGYSELVVSDSGQGITEEFLPYVFDRFRQAEGSTTRRHGGLGLGLALVKQLVEAHGGSVRAESAGEGFGARFTVHLPVQAQLQLAVEPAPKPIEAPIESPGAGGELQLNRARVLVVDDEPDARDLVAAVLRANGAEVMVAGSAVEALDLFVKFPPAVLVSDIGMPETDGYELMRRIRALDGNLGATTPAIAVTAYARERDRKLASEAGFQTHIAKPVEPAELVRAIASVLHRSESSRR